jgi:hypothetical protein
MDLDKETLLHKTDVALHWYWHFVAWGMRGKIWANAAETLSGHMLQ